MDRIREKVDEIARLEQLDTKASELQKKLVQEFPSNDHTLVFDQELLARHLKRSPDTRFEALLLDLYREWNEGVQRLEGINLDKELTIGERLGGGTFGDVYAASAKGTPLALKVFKRTNRRTEDEMDDEVRVLKQVNSLYGTGCSHRNVGCYIASGKGIFKGRERYFIITERVDGVDAFQFQRDNELNRNILIGIAIGLIEALVYIHSLGVYHNDIKLTNIMIRKDKSPVLIDFGLGCVREQCFESTSTTYGYGLPEIYHDDREFSELGRSDQFALGAALYELASGFQFPGYQFYESFTGEEYEEWMRSHTAEDLLAELRKRYPHLMDSTRWRIKDRVLQDVIISLLEKPNALEDALLYLYAQYIKE